MFSQTAEYALRATAALAERESAVTAAELARLTDVPPPYLFKVMAQLTRAGLVTAQRGKYGGYLLTSPPSAVTLLDVINAVDPIPRIHHCPLGKPEHELALCPLHRQLDAAYAQIEQTLRAQTLADVT